MKNEINRSEKIIAIKRILETYPAAFEGKSEALAAKDSFVAIASELAQKINQLVKPARAGYITRIVNRSAYNQLLSRLVNISLLMAYRLDDAVMISTLKDFGTNFERTSVVFCLAVGDYLLQLFETREEMLIQLGAGADDRSSLQAAMAALKQARDDAAAASEERRLLSSEIDIMIKQCNALIRNELDRFVRYHASAYPGLSQSYMRIRRVKRKRSINLPATSDISGQVLDSLTNEPIPGATITLLEHAYAEQTDNDGQFELDELEAGSFTLSCHAEGYLVPPPAHIVLTERDSVIYNFSLQRAESTAA